MRRWGRVYQCGPDDPLDELDDDEDDERPDFFPVNDTDQE